MIIDVELTTSNHRNSLHATSLCYVYLLYGIGPSDAFDKDLFYYFIFEILNHMIQNFVYKYYPVRPEALIY